MPDLYFYSTSQPAIGNQQTVDNQGHGLPVQILDASGNPIYSTAVAAADATANPTAGAVRSFPFVWNGATWDRVREPTADALAVTGVPGAGNMVYNGATWDRVRSAGAAGAATTGIPNLAPMLSNGATLDPQTNNTTGTLLASAARTAQTSSAVQTNYNARGVILALNITVASGAGGLKVTVQAVDPVSSNTGTIGYATAATAITTTTTGFYIVYPGVTDATAQSSAFYSRLNAPLPRSWQATVTVGDSSSYTYSLGYQYII